ncbi:MAG: hypothetical protein K9M49_06770 [Candidatus Marinimicrobia bacterium]|nr:hypothetical protein [Candidatus Neomarinimicrobiota bacterium]MCF7850071.1 hypothetical protein [Candidatus Neomarinimicrobiota bacterium]MCF7904841.1 hypothetical protein [Candidatus Neomarinimicrobiota bacterium]
MRVYLAGAIEAAPDGGTAWRRDLTTFLNVNLSWDVFDPSVHEQDLLTAEEKDNFRQWKSTDINRFMPVMKKIMDRDIHQLLKKCDRIICLWDSHVKQGGGTHGELTLAYEHKMPVYLVLGMPIAQVPSWIIGCTTEVFENFDDLKQFLLKKA